MFHVRQCAGVLFPLATFCVSTLAAAAPETVGLTEAHIPAKTARGVLVAGQSADIAAGMTGRLTSAPWKAGQYVETGAIMAEFDCDRQRADLAARKTAQVTASLKYDNQAELLSLGAAGALDVSIAKSERNQIAAEITAMSIALRDCTISAPFPGYVTARHVNAFETPQAGQPIYAINRAGTTEITVIAPSDWAGWVKSGSSFEFRVDETGETVAAKVLRLSAVVDPVSQTIEITARPTVRAKARPGMSGVAVFP